VADIVLDVERKSPEAIDLGIAEFAVGVTFSIHLELTLLERHIHSLEKSQEIFL
jgi:hypothetical protein